MLMSCLFLYEKYFIDRLMLNCQVPRSGCLKIPSRYVLRNLKTLCFELQLVCNMVKLLNITSTPSPSLKNPESINNTNTVLFKFCLLLH